LEQEGVTFSARTKRSPAFGAGLPEITDLILALGTAGVFTALVAVFQAYFRDRPMGSITIRSESDKGSMTITAENCDAAEVAKNLNKIIDASK
jgi:hypothetical protein